ncbi:MAG: TldD/PmbA family protein [Anaerolineae bacterium]|nr:TldD/PmbA family protein [Anaerolineae bacterium]
MRDRLTDALRTSDAEFADIRIEDVTASQIRFGGKGELEDIGTSKTVGGIVRALVKGGWGYAKFNDLNNLNRRVEEACESARLVSREKSHFAHVERVVDEITVALERDFRSISLAQKKAVLEEYNHIILGYHPKVKSSEIRYEDSFRKTWYANSEGTYIVDEQPDVYAYIGANARHGENGQTAFAYLGGVIGFQVVEGFQGEAEAIARRAVDLLDAPPVAGGTYTVILNPEFAGSFIHEAFGHLSEADHIHQNEQLRQFMQLGRRIGSDILNVIDDGTLPGQRGTRKYDNEGVPTQKTYLIRDGILAGRLHSRESAASMNEQPTGSARAVGYHLPPITRMSNTYIDKGTASFEDMIRDIKLGVYAVDNIGGATSQGSFTFSAAYGYMIRNGQIAEMVRDVVMSGNAFETLMEIDMLSDRVVWGPGGMCGYDQHFPLPVGMGGPFVRVQNVVVGGRS